MAKLDLYRLPPPEPAYADRKDNRWSGKSPDEKIGRQGPCRVYRPTFAIIESCENEEGVEDQGYKQLEKSQ